MGSKHNMKEKELLNKLSSGALSNIEKDELRAYIESTFQDEKLNKIMSQHWNKLDDTNQEIVGTSLDRIRQRILSIISKDQLASATTIKRDFPSWKTYLIKVAAILFIPLLISSAYLFFHLSRQQGIMADQEIMQQVVASPGSRVHFVLPDQTEVWLNSASTLEFPINLNFQKQRKVKLTGQGYFIVSHDKKRPFLVETDGLNIRVLGTSFDVSSYSDDQSMSSTLEEGTIALLNSRGKEIVRLYPGQHAVIDKETRKFAVEEVNTKLITSWKDGRLIFKNSTLPVVVKQLERWFNCNIHITGNLLESDILYTATIQDETLGEVLQMIEISTSLKTQIKNREVKIWLEK